MSPFLFAVLMVWVFILGSGFGWVLRSRAYKRTKLPEISRLIEVIGEGINVGQADPEAPNPYERVLKVGQDQSVEYHGFQIGHNAGKLFHENMRAFEIGRRFEAQVIRGYNDEKPEPAVSWLKQCYEAGVKIRERQFSGKHAGEINGPC